jgi:hypothetical protein
MTPRLERQGSHFSINNANTGKSSFYSTTFFNVENYISNRLFQQITLTVMYTLIWAINMQLDNEVLII